MTADEFVQNVDGFVKDKPLQRFFKNRPDFIQTLARKATELSKNPNTDLGSEALLPKTIQVSLHQQVIYYGEMLNIPCTRSNSVLTLLYDNRR